MGVSFDDAINTVRDLIFTLYTVLEEGIFDDGAQTEEVARDGIARGNEFLRNAGHPEITQEDWRAERDS